jgi:cyanophycinase
MAKGTVLMIGGAEDRGDKDPNMKGKNAAFDHFEILKELLPSRGAAKKKIEIITTASETPGEMSRLYSQAFKKIGFTNVGYMEIRNKQEARDPAFCKRIENAHAVFLSGGDQFRLSAILGGTTCNRAIREKYLHDKDFVVAGTSAGAMALSAIMIYEGGVQEAILKDDLRLSSGLALFDHCIVDTHFIKRGRFGRLVHAVTMNPQCLGIGLGEDTALIIKRGNVAECRGSGSVIIVDGNEITQTNIAEADTDMPIFVENLKVHLLCKYSRFSISDRKFMGAKK